MTSLTNSSTEPPQNKSSATPAQGYGFGVTVSVPFDEAITRTTEALKAEGFGVLTTIDVQATMKAKLHADFERYVILGACNPPLAHRALEAEHMVGLLLPCNIVVHEVHESDPATSTRVEVADPLAMLGIIQNPALREVAVEARTRLKRVIAALETSS